MATPYEFAFPFERELVGACDDIRHQDGKQLMLWPPPPPPQPVTHTACGTPDCCGSCDSANP